MRILACLSLAIICASVAGQKSFPFSNPDSIRQSPLLLSGFCGNTSTLELLRENATLREREEKMNQEILIASRTLTDDTITLPVVVHIINTNPNSISDLQVVNGIKDLNDAFSKKGSYSASLGADTKIRFCLSQTAPDNGISTGITRTTSYFSNSLNKDNEDARLKNLIQWDPTKYINIWLVTSIEGEAYADYTCGTWYRLRAGGYATMPPGGGPLDGIVVTGFGKLLAHEMGHYLALYHTFEGGCLNDSCEIDGDRVCDTPPDGSVFPSASCSNPQNSCNTDTFSRHSDGHFFVDVPDQIANFMDYGNNACSNLFTKGQADRMRAAITTQRSGLLQAKCAKPCSQNIIADFIRDVPYPIPNTTINFTNMATGASNYIWLINDSAIATTTNFTFTFTSVGKFKVTLKAFNDSTCFASYSNNVIVNCGVTARFYTNKQVITSKLNIYTDSILFTNTSYNAQSYQWLISNNQGMAEQVVSTAINLTYVFPTPATYKIRLIATNGTCADTTELFTVPVIDPTPDGVPFISTVNCYQQNKIRIGFCLINYGYAPLPINTPVTFYEGDPRIAGAKKLSPTFHLPSVVTGPYCYNCFTHVLDVPYRGLGIIYIVFNDSGSTVPIVLPNTPFVEMNYTNNFANFVPIKTTINTAICFGKNYAGYSSAGTYIDTFASKLTGCDSIRTLNLTVKPVFTTTVDTAICQGQNYAGHTTTGTFVNTFIAINGCDSTRTLHLLVKPTFKTTISASICEGDNYAGHITTGTFIDVYKAKNGCDSTRTLLLTVKQKSRTNFPISICQGQNYAGHVSTGTYTDIFTGANGCDSIRTVVLTVKPVFSTTISASICQGQNYAGHIGSGTYVDVYTAVNGCDSTRTLNLTVNPLKYTTVDTAICEGENYAGHSASGTYVDVYSSAAGCDSTRTLHLIVKPKVYSNVRDTICEGKNHAGHTLPGTYVDTYTGINGCDSIRTLQLVVNPKRYTTVDTAICRREKYFAGKAWQTETGIYIDTARTFQGCDSVITTNLTVHPLPAPNLGPDRGICIGDTLVLYPGQFTSYLWHNGNKDSTFATQAVGTYWVSVTNTFGCRNADTMRALKILPLPADFLPPDTNLCRGNILVLGSPGFTYYKWSTGSIQRTIDVTSSGKYGLQATDRYGCVGNDSLKVFFYNNCITILIPDAFTPNKDGKNDVFKPLIPAPARNYDFRIFNRWGQLLFKTNDQQKGWDGNFKSVEQPSGTFIYQISFKDIDGKDIMKYGTVVLIK